MTQYQRITGKVFGGNATATGNDPQIAQFGSALANTFVGTTDPATIQQLPAWGQGWIGAVTPETQFPPLPEMTGAMKVLSHQICGILQQGVSTWDSGTIYYTGNFVSLNGRLYISQVDENQGNNPATDTTNWQEFSSGGGLEIGDIGIAPLGIDETKGKRRYLNGQIVIQEQYTIFTEKVKSAISLYPTLECTEQEWQTTATMSVGGQVGKFVVDDEAGTIRLPKIIMPIQGLTDLSKLGEIVEAGLPNIKTTGANGVIRVAPNGNDGSIGKPFISTGTTNTTGEGGVALHNINIDISTINSTYGNSTTVQQEQIQYPYFIQVATGSETEDNIINTLELNNPFVLLEPKYFEAEVYNVSWLRSNGQNNSGAIYPSVYQALLVENNAEIEVGSTVTLPIGTEYTKRGLSVKLWTDDSATDYDFRINTAEETFRLPIKVNLASGKAVVGNGLTLGLTNGTNDLTFTIGYVSATGSYYQPSNVVGESVGTESSGYNAEDSLATDLACGVTTDPTKSGIETSDNDLFLYFYVGETVQNANLVNVGRIEEKLVDKADTDFSNITDVAKNIISEQCSPDTSNAIRVSTSPSSKSSYTAPKDGWFCAIAITSSSPAGLYLSVNGLAQTSAFVLANYIASASKLVTSIIPVSKNDTVYIGIDDCKFSYGSYTNLGLWFIPKKGAQ